MRAERRRKRRRNCRVGKGKAKGTSSKQRGENGLARKIYEILD